ncbi:TolC family protein [Parvularcula marina]|uniref:TolC family protein n=1 Tax=Parvularcula marina TaxID=2292771 RepID=A0A371RI17_9PROT|nr:TolC family protein [Parvularcula marina]RFB05093.1 hypothetical protein DX908_07410 [Parvularcula marina]
MSALHQAVAATSLILQDNSDESDELASLIAEASAGPVALEYVPPADDGKFFAEARLAENSTAENRASRKKALRGQPRRIDPIVNDEDAGGDAPLQEDEPEERLLELDQPVEAAAPAPMPAAAPVINEAEESEKRRSILQRFSFDLHRDDEEEQPSGPELIVQRESLHDGDAEQYQKALEPIVTKSTLKRDDINQYFIAPPDNSGDQMRLEDVLIYTLSNSPRIGAARWRAEDARYAVRASRADMMPQVQLGGASGVEGTHLEGQPRVSILQRSEAYVRIRQRIFDFGRTSNSIKRAKSLQYARELEKRDTVEDTAVAAINAYLNLISAEQLVASSEENITAHEDIVSLVQKNFDAGNISEAELKRAMTRLDRARTNLIDLQNRRQRAIGDFRRITGLEPGPLVVPAMDLSQAYELKSENMDEFLQHNPAMQALLREMQSIRHQSRAVARESLPDIDLQVSTAYKENILGAESWASDARAMVTATWQAYDGGQSSAKRGQLNARENETRQLLLELRGELKQDAYNIISVLQTSQDKRDILREQVDASERVVELYKKQFEAGRRSLLDLLDAQSDLSVAREELIVTTFENTSASIGSLRIQNILLEYLIGEYDLPGALNR